MEQKYILSAIDAALQAGADILMTRHRTLK